MMIAGGFTCQRYGFNVGADKFSLLTIENGKNKHYAPIGMDIDFPKPKISLRQAAREKNKIFPPKKESARSNGPGKRRQSDSHVISLS